MLAARPQIKLPNVPPPPNVIELKQWRAKQLSQRDELLARRLVNWAAIKQKCADDFVYWAENFCFAYDDHAPASERIIPLRLWDFQKEMALKMVEEIWRCVKDPIARWNGGADKARRMTATFTALLVIQWFAQFHGVSAVVTSKDKELCDRPGDMNSPFERLRWQIEKQPRELLPTGFDFNNKKHYKMRLINFQNGGQISGLAPTGNAMRQGRALIWLGDEFGFVPEDYEVWEASSGLCRVRLIFSTPNGPFCKFYRLVFKKDEEQFHCFQLDWWLHPVSAQGLFVKSDGTYSSPFFEELCRNNSRQVIARDWLRDHSEAVGGRIYPMYRDRDSTMIELEPSKESKVIYRIWDPGLCFAVGWGQVDEFERRLWLHELIVEREKVSRSTTVLKATAEKAIAITEQRFPGYQIIDLGDPYGSKIVHSQQTKTEFEELFELFAIRVQSAYLYKVPDRCKARIEEVSDVMTTDVELEDGSTTPQLLIDAKHCPQSLTAIRDGYRYVVLPNGQVTDEVKQRNHPANDLMDILGMFLLKVKKRGRDRDYSESPMGARRKAIQWRKTQRQMRRYG